VRHKRYEIQFAYAEDFMTDSVKWYSMRTGSSRLRRRAVNNWVRIASNRQNTKVFRLVDTKTGKVLIFI